MTDFLRNFWWQFLFTLRGFTRNLLRGNRRRNTFCILFWSLARGSNSGFSSNKPTHCLLDNGDFKVNSLINVLKDECSLLRLLYKCKHHYCCLFILFTLIIQVLFVCFCLLVYNFYVIYADVCCCIKQYYNL